MAISITSAQRITPFSDIAMPAIGSSRGADHRFLWPAALGVALAENSPAAFRLKGVGCGGKSGVDQYLVAPRDFPYQPPKAKLEKTKIHISSAYVSGFRHMPNFRYLPTYRLRHGHCET